ncbi:hypothetical protein GCM10023206_26150 [Acinetobacter puyangensis]|uniref:Uncharacterized protein n=1 Tax=Acinetobacter puyangensis TaxID=1096779 RepID=A0A240E4D3_9GAMM|nr:hypothetical protein [Acinetobacter puyangensis]SNX43617.1 hypothetical protein SAMN05421731_101659 [Acinetobacter puyangensis]
MSDLSIKQRVLQTIEKLPENVDIESMMYELYVLENIQKGQKDIQNHQIITVDQLLHDIESW